MAHPLSAYAALANARGSSRMTNRSSNYEMTADVAEERRKEEKKRREREGLASIGRLLGGGGAGLLATLLTGGMASPIAAALISGALGGAGSAGGQFLAGGMKNIKSGKWDIEKDKQREEDWDNTTIARIGQDALSSALSGAANQKATALAKGKASSKIVNKAANTPSVVNETANLGSKFNKGLPSGIDMYSMSTETKNNMLNFIKGHLIPDTPAKKLSVKLYRDSVKDTNKTALLNFIRGNIVPNY